jgi:ribosomal protein L39E
MHSMDKKHKDLKELPVFVLLRKTLKIRTNFCEVKQNLSAA